MKRLIFIASLAMLAVGCQKTEIQNEVLTPIGFSTEVGKQTRAIVQDGKYLLDQPFGVYAYGYQLQDDNSTRVDNSTTNPMPNIEISCTPGDPDANPATSDKWAATVNQTVTTKYYWPNDPQSRLDFYAYSPAKPANGYPATASDPHQQLNGTISHSEAEGLKLTDYVHSNMYVDFMVATPVLGATFKDQDGAGSATDLTSVPLSFAHKMTQVNFTVKLLEVDGGYPNINFEIQSIVLNDVVSKATYSYNNEHDSDDATLAWTPASTDGISDYKVYPATTTQATGVVDYPYSYEAPEVVNVNKDNSGAATLDEEVTVVLRTDSDRTGLPVGAENPGTKFSTTPVTMIPQAFDTNTPQSFTIVYTISGTGVATETVTKTFDFADAAAVAPEWGINKKITYTLTISLNEITFAPSVETWSTDNAAGSYVDPED